jgi:hypothetical protein
MPDARAQSGDSVVLLVRHGPRRGRLADYGDDCLRRLARTRPPLRRRIRVHETGAAQPPSLDDVAAVVFLLADPVRERYPACYTEAAEIAGRAEQRGIRMVNPPDTLSNTIKSVQARLWKEAGIPCAGCVPFASPAELEQAIGTLTFPVIVRADLLHAQQFTFVCETPDDVRKIPTDRFAYPGLVLEFIDARATYRATAPESIWARYYHRCRSYVFGQRVLAQAIYFSTDPIVASNTSLWHCYTGRGRWLEPLALVRGDHRRTIAADIAFARKPSPHADLIRRAARALGLEYGAIDFALKADGSAVFWEMNPHPYIPPLRFNTLPLVRQFTWRTPLIHETIGDFLADLLESAG